MRNTLFFLGLLFFGWLMVGCGGDSPDPSNLPQVANSTDIDSSLGIEAELRTPFAPDTVPAPIGAFSLPSIQESLAPLNSYRLEVVIQFAGRDVSGRNTNWRLEETLESSLDPPAEKVKFAFDVDGIDSEIGVLELANIADKSLLSVPGIGCVTGDPGQFGQLSDYLSDLEGWVGPIVDARVSESGGIANGQATLVYDLDNSTLMDWNESDVQVTGFLEMNQGAGFPVELSLSAVGKRDYLGQGNIEDGNAEISINVESAGQTLLLQPPDGCSLNSDLPLVQDAFDISFLEELVSYESRLTYEEVLNFYREMMPSAGWKAEEEAILDETSFLTFSLGERRVSINIDYDPGRGTVAVLLAPEG